MHCNLYLSQGHRMHVEIFRIVLKRLTADADTSKTYQRRQSGGNYKKSIGSEDILRRMIVRKWFYIEIV